MWKLAALWLLLQVPDAPTGTGEHSDPGGLVVLSLAIMLLAAKLGGHFASRIGQPAVLGELVAGVILGNLSLLGFSGLDYLRDDAAVDIISRIGVILLLFGVGLESTVGQMRKVGLSSLLVATWGVIGSLAFGWGVGAVLLPDHSVYVHVFLGATLTATSVGITARVLQDLGRSQTSEARVILGAAVIDDVQGLVILAVLSGIISAANQGGALSYAAVGFIVLKAAAFLIGSLGLGVYFSPRLFSLASRLQTQGVLLALGLSFCFVLAWLASYIGLAPIVGAYAAGLILEDLHYRDFLHRGEHTLEELIHPISSFLVPIFFVLMGLRTNLDAFASPGVLGLASVLCVTAILGKLVCSLGVLGSGTDRLSVGIGMIPRGEVGLIFANIGLTLTIAGERIVDPSVYAAVVVMVIVTTVITPPLLQWSLQRGQRK
jgi:Kef-type K+ transport system membrane component KefB